MKKVANIVIRVTSEGNKATIFYDDGTQSESTYEEAKTEIDKMVKEETDKLEAIKISNGETVSISEYKDLSKEVSNKLLSDRIFVMNEKEYNARKDSFIVEPVIEEISDNLEDYADQIIESKEELDDIDEEKLQEIFIRTGESEEFYAAAKKLADKKAKQQALEESKKNVEEETIEEPVDESKDELDDIDEEKLQEIFIRTGESEEFYAAAKRLADKKAKQRALEESKKTVAEESEESFESVIPGFSVIHNFDIPDSLKPKNIGSHRPASGLSTLYADDEYADDEFSEEEFEDLFDDLLDDDEEKTNPSFFEKVGTKIGQTKIGKAIKKFKTNGIALGLAGVLAISGVTGCALNKKTVGDAMYDSNITLESETTENGNDDSVVARYAGNSYTTTESETVSTFDSLLAQSTCEQQVTVMQQMSSSLDMFNITFADSYLEDGKEIKAALTWDEMMAIQMAYNDGSRTYRPCEIRKIFNGTRVSDEDMTNAYKNATLQLMGAYVIEREGHLVDLSQLIHDEEGLAFAQKYQNLLETAKNTTGDAQIAAVEAFYNELYKDFPISRDERTVGISHADTRNIKSYELSVAPMVAAAEMMFQNLSIDETLTDEAIAYFNDLGLCNLAQDTFEELETITITNCDGPDETLPLYEDFKQAKIDELTATNHYVIDDYHRDLSQLDSFQERVNGKWFNIENGQFVTTTVTESWSYTTSYDYTETTTNTWTETTTETRNEQVDESDYQWEVVDTTDNSEEMQEEADKHKEELEKEVEEDDKDLQEDIDDANDKIDNGETVNEDDFGDHNVDFDDEHSDENGNLDDSVKDITTDDGSSTKTTEDDVKDSSNLPDPNATGSKFDESYQESDSNQEISEDTSDNGSDNSQDSSSDEDSTTDEDTNSDESTNSDSSSLPDPEETGKSFDQNCETTETTTTTTETTTVVEETYEEVTEKSDEEKVNEYVESLSDTSEDENEKVLTK